ncbi:MAG: sigma-70 family RNA polymerase sigma factor [Acidobacteriia bacterium]|nr:sigma-70 family RNA polymerase sigma factor [Terriglobia bacterium]
MTPAAIQRMEAALARWGRGESSAFVEIVREHQAMVFSMAYYFLHDRSVAEEIAQDVFLRLYRNLAGIKSPAHLMLWLRKVTSRRCIDEVRRNPARPQVSLEEAPEPFDPSPPSDPLLSRRLRRLVTSLPENARMVIILRFQEELELAEIAEILEIPINTVKSRLQRSLAMLREKLDTVLESAGDEAD